MTIPNAPPSPPAAAQLQACDARGIEKLHLAFGAGFAESTMSKKLYAPLDSLITVEKVFQPRDFSEDRMGKRIHQQALRDVLRRGESGTTLDPILVFPLAGHRIVIDGHGRLAAYRGHSRKTNKIPSIPIRYFQGSLKEALLQSSKRNLKGKLALSLAERQERAWQLSIQRSELEGSLTLAEIAAATDVSPRQVARMSSLLRDNPKGTPGDPRGRSWRAALADVRGIEDDGTDPGDRLNAKVEKITQRFTSALTPLGRMPGKHPELFVEAMYRHDERLLKGVFAEARQGDDWEDEDWGDGSCGDEEAEENDDF